MSSDSETHSKTVTLPTFQGGKKKFAVWWKRFLAYATLKKFAEALEPKFVLPSNPDNLTGTDD